ncbi:MAG: LysR family transcriptional regulator [Flavobacteriales bacterium]|nr:LysR family transcriptional regulator [Flavobacteriales bacterium]
MTLVQLEYVVAVDTHRHFGTAAKHCFVTQPTLSMQLQKLEEELGIRIFDRSRLPVVPTEAGHQVVAQARRILKEAYALTELANNQSELVAGEIRLGIIPTLAPYLLPSLYRQMRQSFPQVTLVVRETITEEILRELKQNRLDCALLATPIRDASVFEDPLFYEELYIYLSKKNPLYNKRYVLPGEISADQLWLLEEGHCFRSQVLNLCELRKGTMLPLRYETGNIDTLKRLVDETDGITILPELAIREFSAKELNRVKRFKSPFPTRQISLVTHRQQIKTRMLEALKGEVLRMLPQHMMYLGKRMQVEIDY